MKLVRLASPCSPCPLRRLLFNSRFQFSGPRASSCRMNAAIIVAAGKGTRVGHSDTLLMQIAGKPLVADTWARVDACAAVDEIVLVIRPEHEPILREVSAALGTRKPFKFAAGGKERQDSVWNGLEALSPSIQFVA